MNEWEWQLLEEKTPVAHLQINGIQVKPGHRVRLRPRKGGDVIDIALAGQTATVEGVEQDYEGKQHVCVVLDDDPGKDMGLLRQPGHRFFFDADEVEPLPPEEFPPVAAAQKLGILVAGIGNIFFGDDGFGVEVVRRLAARELPPSVRVNDFGIRGFDLVYALQDGYGTTILVDACPRGSAPGTLYVIEPDLKALDDLDGQPATLEAHAMNPMSVLRMARAMNIDLKNIWLVGCEPENLGGEEGHIGLTPAVEAAVDDAVRILESLIEKLVKHHKPVATPENISR